MVTAQQQRTTATMAMRMVIFVLKDKAQLLLHMFIREIHRIAGAVVFTCGLDILEAALIDIPVSDNIIFQAIQICCNTI